MSRALAVLASALVVFGCSKTKTPAPVETVTPAPAVDRSDTLAAETLLPVFDLVGVSDGAPNRLEIRFSRGLVDPAEASGAPKGLDWSIRPTLKGTTTWADPATLVFTPEQGFPFAQKFEVELRAVPTRLGLRRGPTDKPWRFTFETPRFAFLRMLPHSVDIEHGKISVDLVFSGAVNTAALRSLLTLRVDGRPVGSYKLSSEEQGTVARASLSGLKLSADSVLSMVLLPGAKAVAGGSAEGADGRLGLFSGEPVVVKRATLQEGPTGFFVDVLCDDSASQKTDRYYWDSIGQDSYRGLSARCQPIEAAIHQVKVSPAMKISLSPTEHGFRILGDFRRGTYTLTLLAGLASVDGGSLRDTFHQTLRVPARTPQVAFGASGRYLPRHAWRNLPVRHLNVEKVQLSVRQVPPENLVFWLSNDDSEAADERTSTLILTKSLQVSPKEDTWTTTYLDIASLLPGPTGGVLELELSAPGVDKKAAARIVVTDLALIAKRASGSDAHGSKGELWIWALDTRTGERQSGVEVSLVRRSGQRIDTCTTAGDKGCRLKASPSDIDPAQPFALIARKGNDITYLKYKDLEVDLAESDVGGVAWTAETPYEGFVYADRGVYRPGDTAHVSGIVRDAAHRAPKAGMPVVVRVLDPQSKELLKRTVALNEAGLFSLDVPFADYAATGRHEVRLEVAERGLTSLRFNVEEFAPERMKVTAQAAKPAVLPEEEAPVRISARYLFGSVPAGASYELGCALEPFTFAPKKASQFRFGPLRLGAAARPPPLEPVTGKLDDKGEAAAACAPAKGSLDGPYRLRASVGVTEAGSGRASVGETSVMLHPEKFYVGLRTNAGEVNEGDTFQVEGTLVDWEGNALSSAPGDVELQLLDVYREWSGWWDEDGASERHEERYRTALSSSQPVKLESGGFKVGFTAHRGDWNWAGYVVRARLGKATSELRVVAKRSDWFWDESGGGRVDRTPRPMRPTPLVLEAPGRVNVGQPIAVKVKAPFKGQLLLTVESDRVLAAEWKRVDAGEVVWTYTPTRFAPNVYLSALLVKDPHAESAESYLPNRAFGTAMVALEPTEHTQGVVLHVPDEVRSGAELTVSLQLGAKDGASYATVAVVDEGILQLTKQASPDPVSGLFQRRALGVTTYETIGWSLLMPAQGSSRPTGGDGSEGAASGRVQPIRPVALWSGVVRVSDSGKAEVKLKLPTYRGAVRVMAVVAGAQRVGAASRTVRVTDPLVLMTTLPRFVIQGDTLQIPVFVTNLTGASQTVDVSLSAENLPLPGLTSFQDSAPLKLIGKPQGQLTLAPGASGTAVFQARADKGLGAARLKILAKAGDLRSTEELVVPFSPPGTRERRTQVVEVTQATTDLKPLVRGWVPTTEKTTFWVTTNPYGESFSHLRGLIQYPHGCIEQTTSTMRPLLYVSNMLGELDPELLASRRVEDMVASGVQRLLSMQTPSGGFAYWPGGKEPNGWGTAYATHLLLDAQKAGFPVPAERLSDALRWMESVAEGAERVTEDPYHGNHNALAYTHYVLALSGKGRKAPLQALIDKLDPRTTDGQKLETAYMLKAALFHAGDRRYERDLRSPDVSTVTDARTNDWSFYSDRRRRGFMLSTFTDLFGNDPAGEPLARVVADALRGHPTGWYTTQDLVWGITGLGKRIHGAAHELKAPTLLANGKAVHPAPASSGKPTGRSFALVRASELSSLTLQLPESSGGKVYLVASSEGIAESPTHGFGGQGLKLSRRLRAVDGDAVDLGSTRPLGQTFAVELTLTNTSSDRVQNVALVDRIAAGWEIENPRLGRGTVAWIDEDKTWKVDAMNLRDDRVELFGALERGQSVTFVYTVRAVTAGTFQLPSAEAEAMYDPRIWAREAGGQVKVDGNWDKHLM